MSDNDPVIYFNGSFPPRSRARASVEDRGTFFADGVYEVTRYCAGRGFEVDAHLSRLHRSLQGVRIPAPDTIDDLPTISQRVLAENGWSDALVYWQVTRGAAMRNLVVPDRIEPSVLVLAYSAEPIDPEQPVVTRRVMLVDDSRWKNCWIKSLMLLPNVLARQAAIEAGHEDALFRRGDLVVEGTSSNLFVALDDGLHTHPCDGSILGGITRRVVIEIAGELNVPVHENPITVDAALRSRDIFLSSSNVGIAAVTHIDGRPIGNGSPGELTRRVHHALSRRMAAVGSIA